MALKFRSCKSPDNSEKAKGEQFNEKNLSTKEKAEVKGTRLQKEDVYRQRQEASQEKKRQRKKEADSITKECMPDKNVLRKQRDFISVYESGKSTGSKYVVILFKKNDLNYSRIAFVASKKVGNSVARNRAKRLMKEAYRHIRDDENLKNGIDIVFVARNTIKPVVKLQDVQKSMFRGLKKLGLIL